MEDRKRQKPKNRGCDSATSPIAGHSRQQTFRKGISTHAPSCQQRRAFDRGCVQPRNAKNAGESLKILTAFALPNAIGFSAPAFSAFLYKFSKAALLGRIGRSVLTLSLLASDAAARH